MKKDDKSAKKSVLEKTSSPTKATKKVTRAKKANDSSDDENEILKKIGRPHLEKLLEKTIDRDEVSIAPKLTIKHVDVRHQESSMPTV